MAELIDIANAFFKNKNDWKSISSEDKDKFSFIFNRYFSKKYPQYSILLNSKNQDKSVILDMWFELLKNERIYPNWFWSKSKKEVSTIDDKDIKLLMSKIKLDKESDLLYLMDKYPDLIKQELDFYKKSGKNRER
jgi:hypothetical protein